MILMKLNGKIEDIERLAENASEDVQNGPQLDVSRKKIHKLQILIVPFFTIKFRLLNSMSFFMPAILFWNLGYFLHITLQDIVQYGCID